MRNLSDTGADKVEAWDESDEYLSLKDYAGRVLIIQEAPKRRDGKWGEFATIKATDEATGETRTYSSGARRFMRQAQHLATEWQGPVRCSVATVTDGQYGNTVAWLEEAPPAQASATKPIYSDLEKTARTEATILGDELHLSDNDKRNLVRVHSDEMGKVDWPAIVHALADIATKRKLAADLPNSSAAKAEATSAAKAATKH